MTPRRGASRPTNAPRILGLLVALFAAYAASLPGSAAAQSFSRSATCGVFFDKWDVPGVPPGTLAMAGLGHEAAAAQDCVSRKAIPMACEHYRRILVSLDKMDPAFAAENRKDVRALMTEIGCRTAAPGTMAD